jgi:hypothetical protein
LSPPAPTPAPAPEPAPPQLIVIREHVRAAESKAAVGSREYHKSRAHQLKNELPTLIARISDASIQPGDLSPLERCAREYRQALIQDLGGDHEITTAQRSLVSVITGSWLILQTIDAYVFETAQSHGLINRRKRSLYRVTEQRMQVADSLTKQLDKLGITRRAKPLLTIDELLRAKENA